MRIVIVRSGAERLSALPGAARARVSVLLVVCVAVLASVGVFASAGSARAAGVRAKPVVLAVWGLIDGIAH
jgi:hypothetical protein